MCGTGRPLLRQDDGNLVIYNFKTPAVVWESGTDRQRRRRAKPYRDELVVVWSERPFALIHFHRISIRLQGSHPETISRQNVSREGWQERKDLNV